MLLYKKPETILLDGHISRFIFGHNPIVFGVARQDHTIVDVELNEIEGTNFTQINLTSLGENEISDGQQISVIALNGSVVEFSGVYVVLEANHDTNDITINLEWDSFTVDGGAVNLILRTKIEVELTGKFRGSEDIEFQARRFSFDKFGNVDVFLNDIVENLFNDVKQGRKLVNRALTFKIKIKQITEGLSSTENEVNINFDEYFIVDAVAQLGQDQRLINHAIYLAPDGYKNIKYGFLYNGFDLDNLPNPDNFIPPSITGTASGIESQNVKVDFRVPSDDDFKELEMYLGMSEEEANSVGVRGTNEGSKLATNGEFWDVGALINDAELGISGFNARGSSLRDAEGGFSPLKVDFYIHTNTLIHSQLLCRNLVYFGSRITRLSRSKKEGKTVRLVRDSTFNDFYLPEFVELPQEYAYKGNDNHLYKTVRIGNQIWLQESLIETEDNNGNPINEITDNTDWSNATSLARCSFDNNEDNAFEIESFAPPKKQFLTAMQKPIKFRGYPFSLFALFDNISNADKYTFNNDTQVISFVSLDTNVKGIYEFEIGETNKQFINCKLQAEVSTAWIDLTFTKQIETKAKCGGVYLKWLNDLGGYDYWLFDGNIKENISASTSEDFEPFIEDTRTARANRKVIKKDFAERQTIYSNFDKANTEAFKQLTRSNEVYIWLNNKWWLVDVSLNNMSVSRYSPIGKISLIVELPKIYLR